jgi:predicted nuclease of predicted toxin-antitoxin system
VTITDREMRFFADHNVPESVSRTLESAGYQVIRLREKTAPDSPDTLVAAVAEANNAVRSDRNWTTAIPKIELVAI